MLRAHWERSNSQLLILQKEIQFKLSCTVCRASVISVMLSCISTKDVFQCRLINLLWALPWGSWDWQTGRSITPIWRRCIKVFSSMAGRVLQAYMRCSTTQSPKGPSQTCANTSCRRCCSTSSTDTHSAHIHCETRGVHLYDGNPRRITDWSQAMWGRPAGVCSLDCKNCKGTRLK